MHMFKWKKMTSKGAALVEYVVLIALIGITLIPLVIQYGSTNRNIFESVASEIRDPSDPTDPGDPGDPGDPEPPIQPPYVRPDPPVFPDPPTVTSGNEYVAFSDQTISFTVGSPAAEFEFSFWIEYAFWQHYNAVTQFRLATPEEKAADLYNWEDDFTATSITLVSGDQDQYNQFEFLVNGIAIGRDLLPPDGWPAVNWGRFYTGAECRDTAPDPISVLVVGYNSNGDRAEVTFDFEPETCPTDHYITREFLLRHNQAIIAPYGNIANAEIPGTTLDWNDAVWTVENIDIPNNNIRFTALVFGSSVFSVNAAVPGGAWAYNSGAYVCGEAPFNAGGSVVGVHPSGESVYLSIGLEADLSDVPNSCFDEFGP